MQLTFQAVSELHPGARWQSLFHQYWPAYRTWFRQRSQADPVSATASRRALHQHMPELVALYDQLVELAGGDDLAARLLSGYRPPPYLISCSQAALVSPDDRVLVRNYDLHPALNEGLILHTRWHERTVMASSEFLWGVADGINDAGLALSLAFGGSRRVGEGFGIPFILRYVLEVCSNTVEAIEALRCVPSHMAYNITLLDRSGYAVTAQVGPGKLTRILSVPVATNHQGRPEWAGYARFTATVEREKRLRERLAEQTLSSSELIAEFSRPPLYNVDYHNGFGTLYTAVYRPQEGAAEWRWPAEVWRQELSAFEPGQRVVNYTSQGATVERPAASDSRTDGTAGYPWSPCLEAWCTQTQQASKIDWVQFGQRLATADWTRCHTGLAAEYCNV